MLTKIKGFMAVLNPGDPVLLETPLYAGVLPPLRTLGCEMIGRSFCPGCPGCPDEGADGERRGRRG
jgi:hypothetical protein